MATELIITSVPKGLKPGSYGFCTAACTKDLNEPTSRALEVISGYRHLFSPEEGKANPVAFSYLLYEFAGRQRRVLSRVADMGLDYSGRTNKIAHHLVLSEEEAKRPAGPAALCASGVFMERWPEDEQPHYLDARTVSCSESINVNAIKTGAWQKLTGDSGWAGVLAGTVLTRRPVILIVRPDQDVLTLFREALVLLKPEERWKATFSTYYTSLPANAQCQWRALVDGAYDEKLLRIPNAITLDLRNPGALPRVDEIALTSQEKPLVDLARGAASASAEAPQSWEPLGLTPPEEAPKSRAPGRGPNPFNRKDDVFFGSVDNGDNSTLGEGYKPDGSTGVSYMPPSHKKSGMIWVLIGFLAGLVILAIVALAFWFTVGNKKDGDSGAPPAVPGASDDRGDTHKDGIPPANPEKQRTKEPVPQEVLGGKKDEAERTEPQAPAVDEDGSSQKEEPNEAETGEADNPPNTESEQHTANPDVLKLEEEWNQLKEVKDFKQTFPFVERQRNEIDRLYKKLKGAFETCDTFFKKYDEHKSKEEQRSEGEQKSDELATVTNLCDQIADAQTAAEYLTNEFDFELFQKKCEFAVQGMDQIIALYSKALSLYKEASSDKDRSSTLTEMNAALKDAHFAKAKSKSSGDTSDEEIENLSDQLKPIRDDLESIYQQRKNELSTDLGYIKEKVSEYQPSNNELSKELGDIKEKISDKNTGVTSSSFANIRLDLEKEILTFVVQTVDSKSVFSVFTNDVSGSFKANIDDEQQNVYPWRVFDGEKDEEADFYKGMKAYADYCMNSKKKWSCGITFTFFKTKEIDAQTKTIGFSPNNKDGEYFSIDVHGADEEVTPVFLGVKGKSEKNHEGRIVFYISDPECIPKILRSVRVRLSFTSTADPEEESISSSFCQLHKPIDMSEVVNKKRDDEGEDELKQFLDDCEFILETDLEQSINNPESENKDGNVFCVVVCDKEGKTTNELGTFSLRVNLTEPPTKNEGETGEKESENEPEQKILLQFSRTAERSDGEENDYTFTHKQEFAHKLLKELKERSFSADYTRGWSSLNEKTTSTDPKVVVDEAFKEETVRWWREEYGTGNLLFYLVYPDEDVNHKDWLLRENWILYITAPYNVVFE